MEVASSPLLEVIKLKPGKSEMLGEGNQTGEKMPPDVSPIPEILQLIK